MFFFSKNKSVLKDLIPDNHVDIHSHLLPGIDDGARTFADSLRLTKSKRSCSVKILALSLRVFTNLCSNFTSSSSEISSFYPFAVCANSNSDLIARKASSATVSFALMAALSSSMIFDAKLIIYFYLNE